MQSKNDLNILNQLGKLPITVILAVKNEATNLPRCLLALTPAMRVILIDSNSTDSTIDIAIENNVEIFQFIYDGGYPKKRQWALDNIKITTPWILFIDADEIVPYELWLEIKSVIQKENPFNGYMIRKGFHFLGRKMVYGGFSHYAVLLMQTGVGKFEKLFDDSADGLDMEVHERIVIAGKIGYLNTPLIHEDFKGLEAYLARHNRYSTWEANVRFQYFLTGRYGSYTIAPKFWGNSQERRRFLKTLVISIPFEPLIWFLYHYIFRFGFLEGLPGFIACQIRANYISQVRSKIYEMKKRSCSHSLFK